MNHRRAFTLIEIILAISLSVLLFGAMIGFYQYAAAVRADATEQIELVQTRRMIMRMITEDLRAATTYARFDPSILESDAENLSFLTTRLPTPSTFNITSVTEKPPPAQMDLYRVIYRLRKWEQDDDLPEDVQVGDVIGIERGVQRILWPREQLLDTEQELGEEDEREVEWTMLTTDYQYLRFGYFDGQEILEERGMSELPVAVEVILGMEPMPEGEDPAEHEGANETHHRQIFVFGSNRVPIQLP